MATFGYNHTKERFLQGEYDPQNGGASHFLMLVMSNTSADTDYDATTVSAISTLDEHDGIDYARIAVTMAGSATDAGTGTNTGVNGFATLAGASSTATFPAPNTGARNTVGAVLYTGVIGSGSDATNEPIAFFDLTGGGSGFSTNSSADVVIQWNTNGILKMA